MQLNDCHAMIDIETHSTAPNAVIVSIAAVLFDPYQLNTSEELYAGHTFYQNVTPQSQPKSDTDPETLKWWERQDQSARDAVLTDQLPIDAALKKFHDFCNWRGDGQEHPKAHFTWANDPSFDCVILTEAFKNYSKFKFPTMFFGWRSFRTAKDLAWPPGEHCPDIQVGVAHNALDDCIKQIHYVQGAFKRFGHC